MLGLDNYGSDDSDSETTPKSAPPAKAVKPAPAAAPKAKRPVRFTVELPKAQASDAADNGERPAKKPRLAAGAGRSSLLAMLPPPKKSTPASAPAPERTLGGAGSGSTSFAISRASLAAEAVTSGSNPLPQDFSAAPEIVDPSPRSVGDFFSLGTSTTTSQLLSAPDIASTPIPAHVSAAPEVEDYKPPDPTPADPYPGYYKLPSGQWAAYDREYYRSFWDDWQRAAMPVQEEKGFEGAKKEDIQTVDAREEVDKGRVELEKIKGITSKFKTGPDAPRMNIARAKTGSVARTRHQLSTLLTDAYENREALEERIAEARRNRKESGAKYGF